MEIADLELSPITPSGDKDRKIIFSCWVHPKWEKDMEIADLELSRWVNPNNLDDFLTRTTKILYINIEGHGTCLTDPEDIKKVFDWMSNKFESVLNPNYNNEEEEDQIKQRQLMRVISWESLESLDRTKTPYTQGRQARCIKAGCPYRGGTQDYENFWKGWNDQTDWYKRNPS
jgi:hypothetical protein